MTTTTTIKNHPVFTTSPPEEGDVCDNCIGRPFVILVNANLFKENHGCMILCKRCSKDIINTINRVLTSGRA